jgi:hypothetical protein
VAWRCSLNKFASAGKGVPKIDGQLRSEEDLGRVMRKKEGVKMESEIKVRFQLNGRFIEEFAPKNISLLEYLRSWKKLTGTKCGAAKANAVRYDSAQR